MCYSGPGYGTQSIEFSSEYREAIFFKRVKWKLRGGVFSWKTPQPNGGYPNICQKVIFLVKNLLFLSVLESSRLSLQ